MKIGELASRAGVSPRLVRYYEAQSLLAPTRQANGYRSYDERHVERVRRIAGLVQSGLTTRLVKELLDLEDAAAEQRPSCPRTVADMLAHELDGIEERIACLTRSRDTIRDYLARTEHAAVLSERAAARG
ncbi:Mercuric resistance operon regulatory protein [Agromyces sp. NDB4Y10]|uniref:MerR family transcriptional regulator n=1 Tax=Agromyces sp. NDB4Y10 TaxID=1775951 RepID=UPI0007B3069F|nr:MerR family transcriptional regulator [Agromyces sp. NDB4Y10]KZE95388.1 Mercuric resistance operon regulatory protein [Agromyces sp. NDB4Y10]